MIVSEENVKPNFDHIRSIWNSLLADYYTQDGRLKDECVVDAGCPNCEEKDRSRTFGLNGFQHGTCRNCESVFVGPRLRDEYLAKLYDNQYYSEVYGKSMLPAFEKRKEIIGRRKYQQTLSFSPKKIGRVLDIGCGVGEVIDVFRDNHWECHATEMNPVALNWLQQKNHNVFNGTFDEYQTEQTFDVIMAWGVIEHVPNPSKFLAKVHRLLRPGGVFVSEVPHSDCLLVDYCRTHPDFDPGRIIQGEQHIILFSIKAYKELHEKAGLKQLHLQTNGLDVQTILRPAQDQGLQEKIQGIQAAIDGKNYGDLLRGFWMKES